MHYSAAEDAINTSLPPLSKMFCRRGLLALVVFLFLLRPCPASDSELHPGLILGDNYLLPRLGIGLVDLNEGEQVYQVVKWALETGYRMIDVQPGTEEDVGRAVSESEIPRNDLYYLARMDPKIRKVTDIEQFMAAMLKSLNTTYLDLVLINYSDPLAEYVTAWYALVDMKRQGMIRSLGLANMHTPYVHYLESQSGVQPSVVQLEIHPKFQQYDLAQELEKMGVRVQSYSPLGMGSYLEEEAVVQAAKVDNITSVQCLLAYCLSKGYSCITKASSLEHLQENFKALDINLSKDAKDLLDVMQNGVALNYQTRSWKDQDRINRFYYGDDYIKKYGLKKTKGYKDTKPGEEGIEFGHSPPGNVPHSLFGLPVDIGELSAADEKETEKLDTISSDDEKSQEDAKATEEDERDSKGDEEIRDKEIGTRQKGETGSINEAFGNEEEQEESEEEEGEGWEEDSGKEAGDFPGHEQEEEGQSEEEGESINIGEERLDSKEPAFSQFQTNETEEDTMAHETVAEKREEL